MHGEEQQQHVAFFFEADFGFGHLRKIDFLPEKRLEEAGGALDFNADQLVFVKVDGEVSGFHGSGRLETRSFEQ